MINLTSFKLKSNGYFCILIPPVEHPQDINQQKGLNLYITVINEYTGEKCFKKLYENNKGKYFKHTGTPPNYLNSFTQSVTYVPFQIIRDEEKSNENT